MIRHAGPGEAKNATDAPTLKSRGSLAQRSVVHPRLPAPPHKHEQFSFVGCHWWAEIHEFLKTHLLPWKTRQSTTAAPDVCSHMNSSCTTDTGAHPGPELSQANQRVTTLAATSYSVSLQSVLSVRTSNKPTRDSAKNARDTRAHENSGKSPNHP